eukprot:g4798.t1
MLLVLVGSAHGATIQDLRTYLLEYHPQQQTPLVFQGMIGSGKFLKSLQCKCETGGAVVVKVYITHDPDYDLRPHEEVLQRLAHALSLEAQPNLLPYQEWQQSSKSNTAFLVRQYLYTSLDDRMSMRPFLGQIEKRWLAYQLLKALQQLHDAGFCHGDVKAENVMVTSWNWLVLTDMAPFKPTYIPEDDPADYAYFFGGRGGGSNKRCCVAPERFFSDRGVLPVLSGSTLDVEGAGGAAAVDIPAAHSGVATMGGGMDASGVGAAATRGLRPQGSLRPSMDVFAAGCVIGELLSEAQEATPLFDLPGLLRYRRGDHASLEEALAKIRSGGSRRAVAACTLVSHMVSLAAAKRHSAAAYVRIHTEPVTAAIDGADGAAYLFPKYFETFLFDFMRRMRALDADERVALCVASYPQILRALAGGARDDEGAAFFRRALASGCLARTEDDDKDVDIGDGSAEAWVDEDSDKGQSDIDDIDATDDGQSEQARAEELAAHASSLLASTEQMIKKIGAMASADDHDEDESEAEGEAQATLVGVDGSDSDTNYGEARHVTNEVAETSVSKLPECFAS